MSGPRCSAPTDRELIDVQRSQNAAFAQSSFLDGANAAYIEQMQAIYDRNPGGVPEEWRRFFETMQDAEAGHGPSWARNGSSSTSDQDLQGALTGDYGPSETELQGPH